MSDHNLQDLRDLSRDELERHVIELYALVDKKDSDLVYWEQAWKDEHAQHEAAQAQAAGLLDIVGLIATRGIQPPNPLPERTP